VLVVSVVVLEEEDDEHAATLDGQRFGCARD